jgi:hypothetical protein
MRHRAITSRVAIMAFLATGVVAATASESPWPPTLAGLVYLWENAHTLNEGIDAQTGVRRQYTGRLHGRATVGPHYELQLAGGHFASDEVDAALLAECQRTNELTIEAVISSDTLDQTGPARIITFSSSTGARNFTLGQSGGKLVLRVRTPRTGGNGTNHEFTLGDIQVGKPQHVIATYRRGALRAYLDGERVFAADEDWGDFSNWEPQRLVFGDEVGGDRDWSGSLEGVAIYARFMPERDAVEHYDRYRPRLAGRQAPPRAVVEATLRATSPAADPTRLGTYRRALVEHLYDVTRVVSGTVAESRIVVAHRAVLDGVSLPDGRRVGGAYRLTLEPWEAHPQLGSEWIENYLDESNPPVFHDVGRTVEELSRTLLRVNAGGPQIGRPDSGGYWESDGAYARGGASFPFDTRHDLSKAEHPAPQQVYHTVRHQDHRYDFADIPDGAYIVRFHFTDGFASDDRAMDYIVEGERVVDNLNIYRTAGATSRAFTIDTYARVSDGNGLQIECRRDRGNDVFEAGIEILTAPRVDGTVVVVSAPARQATSSGSVPDDLAWLRDLCGDGALAYQAEGKIHLTELSTGDTETVGPGRSPEFSPDSS